MPLIKMNQMVISTHLKGFALKKQSLSLFLTF